MPYRISHQSGSKPYVIQVKKGGKWRNKYRHPSKEKAKKQLAALNIHVMAKESREPMKLSMLFE